MDYPDRAGHVHPEDDFEVEITDLEQSDVVESSAVLWLAPTLLDWQRSSHRRHWRWVSTVGIPLLLVIMFSLSNGLSSLIIESLRTAFSLHTNLSSVSSLSLAVSPPQALPQQDGITCLVDAAWSPDAKLIAVLGYKRRCLSDTYEPGLVNIYDGRTNNLIAQLHPDNPVARALEGFPTSPRGQFLASRRSNIDFYNGILPAISYTHVLWSPDSSRLALTFRTLTIQPAMNGVVLMSKDGAHRQVLLQHQSSAAPSYAEWNISRNSSVPLNVKSSSPASMPLPPALAYHWGTNGTLVPEDLLTNTSRTTLPPIGPVGNPDGSRSFSIWQPGFANVLYLENLFNASNIYTWNTDFAAWSPDGQYIVDGIRLSGLLKPPGHSLPSHKALVLTGMDEVPVLPVRDAAFMQVVDGNTELSWSPNGRIMAAYASGDVVELFDCISGHKIRSFLVHSKSASPAVNFVIMRWSPDGTRLLLSSIRWGLVTIWGPIQSSG